MRIVLLLCTGLSALSAQAPPGYYASVSTASAAALRTTLHDVIDDHVRVAITGPAPNVWTVLEAADEDPANASRILDILRNRTFAKAGGSNPGFEPALAWPSSYGFPVNSTSNYPFTDCHGRFLCNKSYSTLRSDRIFDNGAASWTELTTDATGGFGGGSGVYPGNSNWTTSSGSLGAFEVWGERRGDIARALFYMDLRYEGGTHQSGASEPDLVLTDDPALINQSATGSNLAVAHMGKLSVLLQWHAQDPVDAKEFARNNAVFAAQGNRNPFIDNPGWVDCVYLGTCASGTAAREPEIWINELHYDNVGVDVDEFVELAGRADETVDGWMLIGYDAATGRAYDWLRLEGSFKDQANGFGTKSFAFPDLRDGAGGVALVTAGGVVQQFLSYGGTVTATNGACKGLTSVDIGVSQSNATPVGETLQLSGTGRSYAQFTWQPPAPETEGNPNTNQVFQ